MSSILIAEEDLSFYTSEHNGIPTVDRVQLINEKYGFADPRNKNNKPIFSVGQYDGDRMFTLRADMAYFYSMTSAMMNKANNLIKAMKEGEKKEASHTDSSSKIVDPEQLTKMINGWKENHKQQPTYFTRSVLVSTPIRYYTGKQGDIIALEAGFDKLGAVRLASIADACDKAKGATSELIKNSAKDENGEVDAKNPWISERYTMTHAAKEEILQIRLDYYTKYSDKKSAKAVEQEFYLKKPKARKPKDDSPSGVIAAIDSNAYQAMEDFNRFFCVNAINKDQLVDLL